MEMENKSFYLRCVFMKIVLCCLQWDHEGDGWNGEIEIGYRMERFVV